MSSKNLRIKTRKLLYQELFANTFQVVNEITFYASFFDDKYNFEKDDKYLKKMKQIIKENEGFFIEIIEKYSPKFDFSKMSVINILPIYISFAEIFFLDEELAIKISINEAVELAKRYGDDSSKRLVNGILGQVVNNIEEWDKKKRMGYNRDKTIFK